MLTQPYRQNHYQMVRIKDRLPVNYETKWGLVKHGLPQESILGPLFFLPYKDLLKVTNHLISKGNDTTICL